MMNIYVVPFACRKCGKQFGTGRLEMEGNIHGEFTKMCRLYNRHNATPFDLKIYCCEECAEEDERETIII